MPTCRHAFYHPDGSERIVIHATHEVPDEYDDSECQPFRDAIQALSEADKTAFAAAHPDAIE